MTSSGGEAVHAAAERGARGRAAAEAEELPKERPERGASLLAIKKEFPVGCPRKNLRARKNLSIPRFERGTFRMLGERHDQLDHTDRTCHRRKSNPGRPRGRRASCH